MTIRKVAAISAGLKYGRRKEASLSPCVHPHNRGTASGQSCPVEIKRTEDVGRRETYEVGRRKCVWSMLM